MVKVAGRRLVTLGFAVDLRGAGDAEERPGIGGEFTQRSRKVLRSSFGGEPSGERSRLSYGVRNQVDYFLSVGGQVRRLFLQLMLEGFSEEGGAGEVLTEDVMEIMADATNVIAEGEVLQLMNAQDPETTEERYLEVIYRKTAQLFEAGAEVAAVLCGGAAETQRALAAYGKHLGTAYQLIDDVLDYRSDPASRGKNLGEDLAEGKMTLPLIHALRNAGEADRGLIRNAILHAGEGAQRQGDLDRIIAAIDTSDGIGYTRRRAEAESRAATEALDAVPASTYRDALARLAHIAVGRDR